MRQGSRSTTPPGTFEGTGVDFGEPRARGDRLAAGADFPGAVLLTGGLMLGVYTILGVAEEGWGSSQTLALGAVSIGLLAAFILRQARVSNPLMPLRLFRSRNLSGVNVVQALLVVGMFGMFFLGALYMQRILSYDGIRVTIGCGGGTGTPP